ncbi:hypothetical protein CRM22_003530 [Opisthorchis felineus]|uniref:Glycoside hydrolase family 5 domain-containing protein n=1 Tax=Opisthorchis felineus TaxID=147828 RepID=A0A4S2M1C6_OPIFE|nr:hypothetical protein CRM22_003530 [Opisthorchis felineus]
MKLSVGFVLLIVGLGVVAAELDKIRLDSRGNFVDQQGRIMLFHGFNAVTKMPPWYPEEMTNTTKLKLWKSWGINVVRLGVIWTGVMPNKGYVDKNYMKKIGEIIDLCAEYDIYVLVDMHQDALSSEFGMYDGIPRWLVDEACKTPWWFRYPWPYWSRPSERYWFKNYLTYSCVNCAQQMYENTSGIWTYWGDYWEAVAKTFGNRSNVIGYELINEPVTGNFYKDPRRALPAYMGRNYLLPVYDYLVDRIRKVDTETLIFYEPLTYAVFFRPTIFGSGTGFSRVPGSLTDPEAARKSVLSYHYYCWLFQLADLSRNMTFMERAICDMYLIPASFENSARAVKQTGGGRFLTEFGFCGPDGNPKSINTVECSNVLDQADKHFQSWAYWDGNFFDASGNPIQTHLNAFSRVYPLRTLGAPIRYSFDPSTADFSYSFHLSSIETKKDLLVADIFVPVHIHYPKTLVPQVSPTWLNVTLDGNHLKVVAPAGTKQTSSKVSVSISKSRCPTGQAVFNGHSGALGRCDQSNY